MLAASFTRHEVALWQMAAQSAIPRLGLTGTSCVGKTSLLEGLTERLGLSCVSLPEAAAHFFENDYHPGMGNRFSFAVQARIQIRAWYHEAKCEPQAERIRKRFGRAAIVTDRTLYDAPAYLLAEGDENSSAGLLERASVWVEKAPYDRLYLLDPAGVPFQNNTVRTESAADRQRFHEAFVRLFAENNIAYTVLSGTLEERIDTVHRDILALWEVGRAPLSA